jgi:arabinofuranosyltransferase
MSRLSSNQYLLTMVMLAAVVMLLGTAWICDDAFITLRVIDNFVHGYGLRYNVIERVQVATHPLWLMFLTPFYALTREPMVTTMLVSVMVSLSALWLLATRVAKDVVLGCLLVLVAMASQSIYQFSTSGLEAPLTFILLALFAWQLYRIGDAGKFYRAWIPAGIAGLLLLNRLDLVILVGPVLAYLLFFVRGGERIKVAVAAIFPALAWIVFSVVYFGMPFPNTAYAKLGTGFSSGMLILRGFEYVTDFLFNDPLLALIVGMAVFYAVRSRNKATISLAVGMLLYIGYIIVIGGDFMSGRFFVPPGFLALCILAQSPAPQWLRKQTKVVILLAVGVLGVLLVMRTTVQPNFIIPKNGIADERQFYYSQNGLVNLLKELTVIGYVPIHPWGQRGFQFKLEAQRVGVPIAVSEGNAGMIGFYGGAAVHNIDALALTDAFLARLPAIPGARVGHFQRIIPPRYAESVLKVAPTTSDTSLQPLLNDVILATRAPLFAEGRWDAIWRLLSGQYRWAYETGFYGANR